MITLTSKDKMAALLCSIVFLNLSLFALGGEMKSADSTKENRIEIKDFAFNPKTLTVKSGEKITWINHDDEPHTVVSVEKQFKKSSALDTDQEFRRTRAASGDHSFPDCALYRERCLRSTGGLAEATGSRVGRLL